MKLLACGFGLAEGPVPDPTALDDTVLITDAIGGGIYRLALDGAPLNPPPPAARWPDRRGMGGLALHADGGVVATGRDLVRATASGADQQLADRPAGVTGFNDIAAAPGGGLVAGALRYRPFAGEPPVPSDVAYVGPGGDIRAWDSGTTTWPNGIGFSPDEKTAYIADFSTGTVWAGLWSPDAPAKLKPWAQSPSGAADGLSVDEQGHVWVALGPAGGVGVFNSAGELDTVLDVPANFVSSVCHAGPGRRTLVVTTLDNTEDPPRGGAVFTHAVVVPGAALLRTVCGR
jgi:sugar lactone lactonase YvrE